MREYTDDKSITLCMDLIFFLQICVLLNNMLFDILNVCY